jgi:hypothetical protein
MAATSSLPAAAPPDDIAIASVTALAADAAPSRQSSSPASSPTTAAAAPDEGLLKRFETMAGGVHQRMDNVQHCMRSGAGDTAGMSALWLKPALWGSAAGGAVLGLALFFRPEPLMREPEDEDEDDAEERGPRKFARMKLAAWVGGSFAAVALTALAASKFRRK